ncbi:DUF4278 domain-containing protein [Spirulina subsalsa FACHB-351]|uniref:DUF4278 domain-containing protein n=1 Tax=Spirulina subsalsa FACHB-351 TaxID=234711 RepID=A0ABT3L509_9CYAN|nr:DUF4278 domain-containing protein [Spirulina subsalsa]MCW6036603.1 DUF4278 domain-containing protein [Spirulina subsalsa FACHB-351]
MHLSFLGTRYQSQRQTVETVETDTVASFLGNRYYLHRSVQMTPSSHLGLRKYRGVTY